MVHHCVILEAMATTTALLEKVIVIIAHTAGPPVKTIHILHRKVTISITIWIIPTRSRRKKLKLLPPIILTTIT